MDPPHTNSLFKDDKRRVHSYQMAPEVSPGPTMTRILWLWWKSFYKVTRYLRVIVRNWLSFMISTGPYIFVFQFKNKKRNLGMNSLALFSMYLLGSQFKMLWRLPGWHLCGSTVRVWHRSASAPLPGGPGLPSEDG